MSRARATGGDNWINPIHHPKATPGSEFGLVIFAPHFTAPRIAAGLVLPLLDNLTPARTASHAPPAAPHPGAHLILTERTGGVMARHPGAALIFPDAVPARARQRGDGGENAWRPLPARIADNAARLATIIAAARNWRAPRPSAHDVALGARIAEGHGPAPARIAA